MMDIRYESELVVSCMEIKLNFMLFNVFYKVMSGIEVLIYI